MIENEWLSCLPIEGIKDVKRVSGGDINEAFLIVTNTLPYFLKIHRNMKAHFFKKEAYGLKLLGKKVRTPIVYDVGQIKNDAYILMEAIESGPPNDTLCGRALAQLHTDTQSHFGLSENNYLGTLPQSNQPNKNWASFYINQRLNPLVKMAKEQGYWNQQREKLFSRFIDRFKNEDRAVMPRLLHGDLWRGNVMFTTQGEPVFIDPAVFYGDREMDLAMTMLFGGFSKTFYASYQKAFPLETGFEERVPAYQLYYLLAHLNLFGESYGGSVDRILRRCNS
ncbi:fructosamine kinase family protein [Terrilactibacillus laevilacticus]|uniref:Fructosamine kinase family protein n=1 Tax=Terrilactibacillus laevilacticus TaxID=1380157 RepID=A0ABW5PRX5_9BACI|nr:fructosamine kinase family protein [Terrilactibacillus laevilacticus]